MFVSGAKAGLHKGQQHSVCVIQRDSFTCTTFSVYIIVSCRSDSATSNYDRDSICLSEDPSILANLESPYVIIIHSRRFCVSPLNSEVHDVTIQVFIFKGGSFPNSPCAFTYTLVYYASLSIKKKRQKSPLPPHTHTPPLRLCALTATSISFMLL